MTPASLRVGAAAFRRLEPRSDPRVALAAVQKDGIVPEHTPRTTLCEDLRQRQARVLAVHRAAVCVVWAVQAWAGGVVKLFHVIALLRNFGGFGIFISLELFPVIAVPCFAQTVGRGRVARLVRGSLLRGEGSIYGRAILSALFARFDVGGFVAGPVLSGFALLAEPLALCVLIEPFWTISANA